MFLISIKILADVVSHTVLNSCHLQCSKNSPSGGCYEHVSPDIFFLRVKITNLCGLVEVACTLFLYLYNSK